MTSSFEKCRSNYDITIRLYYLIHITRKFTHRIIRPLKTLKLCSKLTFYIIKTSAYVVNDIPYFLYSNSKTDTLYFILKNLLL